MTLGQGTIPHRFNSWLLLAALATLISLLGVPALAQNPRPLINAPLVPGVVTPGSATFTLTVNGTGFVSGATVYWNGNARTTTFVKSSQLTAQINGADVATAGTESVTVSNPAPGGGFSNAVHFQVVKGGYSIAYAKTDYATDVTPQAVTAADFNGDGNADLAVATGNNTVSVLLGKGDGTFPTHVEYPVPGHPSAILTGDFNGDGRIDLATVDPYQSEITILLGNGDGTFQVHQEYLTGNHPTDFATADVNGDGKLDIIVADLNDNKVAVLLGNGDGTFRAHVDYATGTGPSGVAIGDFNGDGKLDLAVPNNNDDTVAILLGNGDGTFQAPIPFATAVKPNSVVTGDFNGDGILDLAVGTSNKAVSVLLGIGNGTFQNHKEYTIGANAVIVAAADTNADGKLDLITANYNDNTVSVLAGNGDGTFKQESVFPTNSIPTGLAIGDFNNNGKLDIAVAASNANVVSVLIDSQISLTPSVNSFGKQTSGCAYSSKTLTLKNNSSSTYTVPTATFVGAFTSDFTYTTTCSTTLAAGKSCTYSVTFLPTASEAANVQLLLTSSNGSSVGAQFTGQGNIPIYLVPRNMQFPGYQLLDTTSAPLTDTFTNKSCVNIVFSKIDLEGKNQNDFALVPTSSCLTLQNATLGPGASCTSQVTFTPTAEPAGGETVTQVYYGNFTLAKQGLLIQGNGTAVQVLPTSINFGSQKVGTTSNPATVSFYVAGTQAVTISSAVFKGSVNYWSTVSGANQCPTSGSVNPGTTCYFYIVFTPGTTGSFTGSFSIGDSDQSGPQVVSLSGTGD